MLLVNAAKAINYGQTSVGIFESGNVFYNSCEQTLHIAGIQLGSVHGRNWLEKKRPVDVFDAKGHLLDVLNYSRVEEKHITTVDSAPSYYHPSRSGALVFGKKKMGYFGELHPKIGKLFDISERIVCFEIFVDSLPLSNARTPFFSGKIFPKIHRDFAFLFPSKASVGNIVNSIYKLDPMISKACIFDCFDFNITQKSIGISITLEAADRTLTEGEAQIISDKIVKYVEDLGGELRKK
jgi:phenylalanyl-tRNA synthetase beta chain